MPFTSDNELFNAFHRGETSAIEHFYKLNFKPLCIFAERITGTKEDAQDLVTESFIKMLNKREQFQNLSNARSFLYLVTKNACINLLKSRTTQEKARKQIQFLTPAGEENKDQVNEEMLRLHVLQQIHEEIENLPPRCKEIFKLLFLEGLSTDQIADQLRINTQTVRTQKARALQLLKSELIKKNLILALLYLTLLFPSERI